MTKKYSKFFGLIAVLMFMFACRIVQNVPGEPAAPAQVTPTGMGDLSATADAIAATKVRATIEAGYVLTEMPPQSTVTVVVIGTVTPIPTAKPASALVYIPVQAHRAWYDGEPRYAEIFGIKEEDIPSQCLPETDGRIEIHPSCGEHWWPNGFPQQKLQDYLVEQGIVTQEMVDDGYAFDIDIWNTGPSVWIPTFGKTLSLDQISAIVDILGSEYYAINGYYNGDKEGNMAPDGSNWAEFDYMSSLHVFAKGFFTWTFENDGVGP